jgi:hypothetical protein
VSDCRAKIYPRADSEPKELFSGMVKITAMLCRVSEIDSRHPGKYTRDGLDVVFHRNAYATKNFFGKNLPRITEDESRRDARRQENCLHAGKDYRSTDQSLTSIMIRAPKAIVAKQSAVRIFGARVGALLRNSFVIAVSF